MKLTIVIPIFNRADMLAHSLESLSNQTFKDFVVIICDDASTQNLQEAISRFPDLNIEYHRFDKNAGQFKNAMRGLELCQTPLLKFLHSDDFLFPSGLEQQVQAMLNEADAALCLGGSIEFEKIQGQPVSIRSYTKPYAAPARSKKQWTELESFNGSLPSACMFRTAAFRDIGGLNTGLTGIADWEVCVALQANYPVIEVDVPICAYRYHGDQVTRKFFFDTDEAILTKDLFWLTSHNNPHRDRLGLPAGQLTYLRHDIAWQNLRISLSSKQKQFLLKKWWDHMHDNQMFGSFVLSFPVFVIRKLLRKNLEQPKSDPHQGMQKYATHIQAILAD